MMDSAKQSSIKPTVLAEFQIVNRQPSPTDTLSVHCELVRQKAQSAEKIAQ